MAKIFEKKVIIGSVFGMVTTALGIIAIFFPSVFNLEKSKFSEPIDITINSNKDLEDLADKVIKKIINEEKIFKMRVQFCYLKDINRKAIKKIYPNKTYDNAWIEDFFSSTDDGEGKFIRIGQARITYNIDGGGKQASQQYSDWYSKNYAKSEGDEQTFKTIEIKGKAPIKYYGEPGIGGCNDSSSSYVLDEYFLPLSASGDNEYVVMELEYIPKSQVQLMNY